MIHTGHLFSNQCFAVNSNSHISLKYIIPNLVMMCIKSIMHSMSFWNFSKWQGWCTLHPEVSLCVPSTVSTAGLSLTWTLGAYIWTFHVEKHHDRHMSKRLPMQLSHQCLESHNTAPHDASHTHHTKH